MACKMKNASIFSLLTKQWVIKFLMFGTQIIIRLLFMRASKMNENNNVKWTMVKCRIEISRQIIVAVEVATQNTFYEVYFFLNAYNYGPCLFLKKKLFFKANFKL